MTFISFLKKHILNVFCVQRSPLNFYNILAVKIEEEPAGNILAVALEMDIIIDIVYVQLSALAHATNSKVLLQLLQHIIDFKQVNEGFKDIGMNELGAENKKKLPQIKKVVAEHCELIKKLAARVQMDKFESGKKEDLSLEDLLFYVLNISALQIEHKAQPAMAITMEEFEELIGRVKPECRNAELDGALYPKAEG